MGFNLKSNFHSPLRYPGGKGKLSNYVELIFEQNLLSGGHYVEPYAGGASVALSLLFNEYAGIIHINDFDYRIYCFWDSVLNNNEQLCELIQTTKVSMNEWKRQKIIQNKPIGRTPLEIGFSTFFLNRTNRSGILKAGVIGGQNQDGKWKIDARFNKQDLIQRIQKIGRYRQRIKLYNLDAVELSQKLSRSLPQKTLFYFDPPYYRKGKDLYTNFYQHLDHVHVSRIISELKDTYWIVSYDNHEVIRDLYSKYLQRTYQISYHAGAANVGTEILVYSDNLIVPDLTNPSDKKEIKAFYKSGEEAQWIGIRG